MAEQRAYPHLGQVQDPAVRESLRLLWDQVYAAQDRTAALTPRVAALESKVAALEARVAALEAAP